MTVETMQTVQKRARIKNRLAIFHQLRNGQLQKRDLLFWGSITLLLLAAILMRLHLLGVPFDRDSYDEGVYWQTLRAMSQGQALYSSTFYSQPPVFLIAIYPIYILGGQTIWSARLAIALISLSGFLGAALLGKTLAGRIGILVALALLVLDPLYLSESQILQAEAPSTALSLLAVGLSYYWWQTSSEANRKSIIDTRRRYGLAILIAITLALAIFSKLFALSALVPLGLIALHQIWQMRCYSVAVRRSVIIAMLLAVLAFLITTLLILAPFLGSWSQLWRMVISFHLAAQTVYSRAGNLAVIQSDLFSPLGLTALLGIICAAWRKDQRIWPLLAWFLATLYLLWHQTPLFLHHLVALTPPLLGLALFCLPIVRSSIAHISRQRLSMRWTYSDERILSLIWLVIALQLIFTNTIAIRAQYHNIAARAQSIEVQQDQQVANDIQRLTHPDQWVITDAQFLLAQADRNTPPDLVDTSQVRNASGYLTTDQLINVAQQSRVQAVLFYTDRLINAQPRFYSWVQQHYILLHSYGPGRELWSKNEIQ